jgi:hypothetical protein
LKYDYELELNLDPDYGIFFNHDLSDVNVKKFNTVKDKMKTEIKTEVNVKIEIQVKVKIMVDVEAS